MAEPFEIIAAPVTLWWAPVGEPFPAIDAAPAGSWVKVGTAGDRNYTTEGVTVQHTDNVEFWRALGSTGPIKAFRTSEDLMIRITLADLTLEQYALALNHNPITEVGNERKTGLSRGFIVEQRALLLRGPSPYDDQLNLQYEIPTAVQTGSPEVVFQNGTPAALALQWTALEDPDAVSTDELFGRLVADDGQT